MTDEIAAPDKAKQEQTQSQSETKEPFLDVLIAGDLVLVRSKSQEFQKRSVKYQDLFELFANMSKPERMVNYALITALMLTCLARRTRATEARKALFDQKNALMLALLNHGEYKRLCGLKYLKSKNFKVIAYCEACEKSNLKENLPRHKWKFCKDCQVDRRFYNVVSIHHKFKDGYTTVYLGQQVLDQLKNVKIKSTDDLDKYQEECRYKRYLFESRNFSAFTSEGVAKLDKMLLDKLRAGAAPSSSGMESARSFS